MNWQRICAQILHENFNMHKMCPKMVPNIITFKTSKNICTDTLRQCDRK